MRRVLLILALCLTSEAQDLPETDRARLAEAFRLADAVGPDLWAAWDATPFAVLLVADEREFLIRHPAPTPDFDLADAFDPLLGGPVYVRDRTFPPTLLATFPAVGGVPTVVVGTAEATGLASTAWVFTVVHEHVHQLQMSPGYFGAVAELGLDGGDTSGQWMLDYPFPYADPSVGEAFTAYAAVLADALDALEHGARPDAEVVRAARVQLRERLSEPDARYLAFQLWQEGVARYVELRAAEGAEGEPIEAYAALADATPYPAAARALRDRLVRELRGADLAASGRLAFYAVGAAEALVLDATRPGWRARYLTERFDLAALDR